MLNQFDSEVISSTGDIKSCGKIFNTNRSKIFGNFICKSNGLENGIGSIIQGGFDITSGMSVDNFGIISGLENPITVIVRDKLANIGRIASDKNITISASELTEKGGITNSKSSIKISLTSFGKYKTSDGDLCFNLSSLLQSNTIRGESTALLFPNALLENQGDSIIPDTAYIYAKSFVNKAILHCFGNLQIETKDKFVNGTDHMFGSFFCRFKNDWDIEHNATLSNILQSSQIELAPERKLEKAIISSNGTLDLKSDSHIQNTGTIRSTKKLSFVAPKVQHGWAYESTRHESLPELKFSYDYMESQPSYITAKEGMTVDADIFLNTLGIIDVTGTLESNNNQIFLNYAGSIDVHGNAKIKSPIFAQMIGSVKTNRTDKKYRSLEFCNTDVPTFNILNGTMDIDAPYAINSAGHLFASKGITLCGKSAKNLTSIVDISSKCFGYARMFCVNEYNCKKYTDRILGISMAGTENGAIIRAELDETLEVRKLPASVTSKNSIIIDGYKNLKSDGIIHAHNIYIKTGNGTTELGYTGTAILPAIPEFAKTIGLFPYVSYLAENQALDIDHGGDFFFKSRGNSKIPFSIIADGKEDISSMKLPFSVDVMETMMLKRLQTELRTGYIPDMHTFLEAAKKSQTAKSIRSEQPEKFPHLEKYTNDKISIVSTKEAKHGLFFRAQKIGDYCLLFPELHLSPESVHSALSNPSGAIVAQGTNDANVVIDTDGFLHAVESLHADNNIYVRANSGMLFETSTYDAMAITQDMFATTRQGLFNRKTEFHKVTQWHDIKKARDPMLITTTTGDLIIVIPDDKNAEFKGVLFDTNNIEIHGGKSILSPLEIGEVVPCPKIGDVSKISTILPTYLQTVFNEKKDFLADVRIFKNTAGTIKAVGDVIIKATDEIKFDSVSKKFVIAEGYTVNNKTFSTKTTHERVEDSTTLRPIVITDNNIILETKSALLRGLYKAHKDIILCADTATIESQLTSRTHIFESTASNIFSESSYEKKSESSNVNFTSIESKNLLINAGDYHEHSIQKKCKDIKIVANNVNIEPLIETINIYEKQTNSGFNFLIPSAVFAPICEGKFSNAIDAFWRQSSVLSSINNLVHSHNGVSIASNIIGTSLAVHSAITTILECGLLFGIADQFKIGTIGFFENETESQTVHQRTIPSVTETDNIELYASNDICMTDVICNAKNNQSYIARNNMTIKPGYEKTDQTTTSSSFSASCSLITKDSTFEFGDSESNSKSTKYNFSNFISDGTNIFQAGNSIICECPRIRGIYNVFDAQHVDIINQADTYNTKYSSNSYGISTNLLRTAAMMLTPSISIGGSKDTTLNDAYISGDTDFVNSHVNNQGCRIPNIINQGASYNYTNMNETHKNHHFAISLPLNLSSPEAFFYSLGRGVASAAASISVGMLLSETGFGGFASTMFSSLAGSYVNAELFPQKDFSGNKDWKPTGLGSASTVEFSHDNRGFKAINVDYDAHALQETIDTVKLSLRDEITKVVEVDASDNGISDSEKLSRKQKAYARLELEKKRTEAVSDNIDATDKQFAQELKTSINSSELQNLKDGKPVAQSTKNALKVAAQKAKTSLESSKTLESKRTASTSTDLEGSIFYSSQEATIGFYDDRIDWYNGLLKSLSTPEPTLKRSGSTEFKVETTITKIEDRVKEQASQFMENSRSVRSQGFGNACRQGKVFEYLTGTTASVMVDDALPIIGKGIDAADDVTCGAVSTALNAINPATYGTAVRRGLRDGLGASQRVAQNAGDVVQYLGEVALLVGSFGSGSVAKGANVAEATFVANKAKRVAQFESVVKENVRLTAPLNFFTLRSYVREIESVSVLSVAEQQRVQLCNALREKNYVKLRGKELEAHRGQYKKPLKKSLIAEWEVNTGQKWPTYEKDLFNASGERIAYAGKPYQFHHIIPQQYGGPHAWWNGFPIPVPEHQALTHSRKGALYGIIKSLNKYK